MMTSAFLDSIAAFRPAALRMIFAVFAAAVMIVLYLYHLKLMLNTVQYFIKMRLYNSVIISNVM